MKKIEIEIPDGKVAKWVNGVLTLVDEKPQDITDRIKTFEDACNVLGDDHPFFKSYEKYVNTISEEGENDVIAYLKLRIICAALNEEWKPKFDCNECRYFPWLCMYTKKRYEELDENEKTRCIPLRLGNNASADGDLVYVYASYAGAYSDADTGVRISFKTRELAEYCGKQFINIWCDYLFG